MVNAASDILEGQAAVEMEMTGSQNRCPHDWAAIEQQRFLH
jgi:hypothetical protein